MLSMLIFAFVFTSYFSEPPTLADLEKQKISVRAHRRKMNDDLHAIVAGPRAEISRLAKESLRVGMANEAIDAQLKAEGKTRVDYDYDDGTQAMLAKMFKLHAGNRSAVNKWLAADAAEAAKYEIIVAKIAELKKTSRTAE